METGTDTGTFTGEVTLTGFMHDADGAGKIDEARYITAGSGPISGLPEATGRDILTVSYEHGDHAVTASALIRWSVGETQWLRSSHPGNGAEVVRAIDPDMNLNPEAPDSLWIRAWSNSDQEDLRFTATETGAATGVFEGVVAFQTRSGFAYRLSVGNGDTVTAEYADLTLPSPYDVYDRLEVAAETAVYAAP